MLFLPALAALLLQTTTAPDSARGAGARNPAYARDGRLGGERAGRSVDRLEARRVDAGHVGAGVGSRAGVDARRVGDRLLVGPRRKFRSLARRRRRDARRSPSG